MRDTRLSDEALSHLERESRTDPVPIEMGAVVWLAAHELRARRAADLSVEEVEALGDLISYTNADLPASARVAYMAIAKIIAGAKP